MQREYPFLVDGEWISTGEKLEVTSPFDGKIVGVTYRPGPQEVSRAIDASVKAFEKTSRMPTYLRSQLLKSAASAVENRKDELSRVLCLEAGKPIKHARGEVTRAVSTLTIAAEEAGRLDGETVPLRRSRDPVCYVEHRFRLSWVPKEEADRLQHAHELHVGVNSPDDPSCPISDHSVIYVQTETFMVSVLHGESDMRRARIECRLVQPPAHGLPASGGLLWIAEAPPYERWVVNVELPFKPSRALLQGHCSA